MSKGSKVVPVRIPNDLMEEIRRALNERKDARTMKPINFSTWVRQAIREKIAHARRSRARRAPKTVEPVTYEDFDENGNAI